MGCIETHSASEESSVVIAEDSLGFHPHQSVYVDSILRKYSANGNINTAQLTKIGEVLSLNLYDNPPFTKTEDTLRRLISSAGTYEVRDLLIIGILLSQGKANVKAGLIYQVFDEDLSNKVTVKFMRDEGMVRIIEHCCKTLPNLVASGQSLGSSTVKNEKYVGEMELARKISVNLICDRLAAAGNAITEATFVDVFGELNGGTLTTATGIRRFVYDNFVANPQKKVFVNPYSKKQ